MDFGIDILGLISCQALQSSLHFSSLEEISIISFLLVGSYLLAHFVYPTTHKESSPIPFFLNLNVWKFGDLRLENSRLVEMVEYDGKDGK